MRVESCRRRAALSVPRRFASALVLGLLFPAAAMAQAPAATPADDLLGVIQEVLETNPEIGARLEAFHAATEDSREVFGG